MGDIMIIPWKKYLRIYRAIRRIQLKSKGTANAIHHKFNLAGVFGIFYSTDSNKMVYLHKKIIT